MKRTPVGIIGCGSISGAYFENCKLFTNLEIVACADINAERARQAAEKYAIPHSLSVDDLIDSPDIEIVVNLTIPHAHAPVDIRALKAGKHVFSEKPFGLTTAEGREILQTANDTGMRIGCAPDTVLGAAIQTSRKVLDNGTIGFPVGFTAVMQCGGHENWHPSPEFYYQKGGGPMFDMGPYYLHALITLLGPIKKVSGMTRTTWSERSVTTGPKEGTRIQVEVPTHITGLMEFHNGTIGTLVMSFDVMAKNTNPVIEIFGSEGTMRVPDPNGTDGKVKIARKGEFGEWTVIPHTHPYAKCSRGLGVADLASAIEFGRKHRANEEIAFHALEVMEAIHVSAAETRHIELTSTCERPQPICAEMAEFTLD